MIVEESNLQNVSHRRKIRRGRKILRKPDNVQVFCNSLHILNPSLASSNNSVINLRFISNTLNVTKTDLPSYQISNEISNEIEATVPAPFEEETEQFIPTVTILTILFIRLTIFITFIIIYITILASSIFLMVTSPGSHVCHNNANTFHKKNHHHSRTCRRLRRLLRLGERPLCRLLHRLLRRVQGLPHSGWLGLQSRPQL